MDLSRLGVFCFLDPLPGAALGPFAKKVERLGYSALWFAEGLGRESLSLATHLLDQTRTLVIGMGRPNAVSPADASASAVPDGASRFARWWVSTTCASKGGAKVSRIFEPAVVTWPANSCR